MTDADIDKLFVAEYGEEPPGPYDAISNSVFDYGRYHLRKEGFRAAMKSEHVKGLERDAWIRVEDRLPTRNETVLLTDKRGDVFTGYYGKCTEFGKQYPEGHGTFTGLCGHNLGYDGDSGPARFATHWMPLPEPPAEAIRQRADQIEREA